MTYNITKWIVFILIITTGISFLFQEGFKVFWGLSLFLFIGPRLENSMDRVYCGKELAGHKIQISDIAALFVVILEIIIDYSIFVK